MGLPASPREGNMKTIHSISIRWASEGQDQSFYGQNGGCVDEFLSFLVRQGFYDDIQATKRFTCEKEVMNRLKD